ncbi:MAG: efflux RND transporter permease subunit [Deltaproteobacteria bacterium]|nr:efflux RND transporter permease subunit [Deltaproteobacteria bacterium]
MKISIGERIVRTFIDSKLTPLILVGTLLLGLFALVNTPREEEPQLHIPMMDVLVEMPGSSTQEIEQRVSIPLEKRCAEIAGVKDVTSVSLPGRSLVTVIFHVDEDEEKSLTKLYSKLATHSEWLPVGASAPLVKPHSVDDIAMLTVTFWSHRYDHATLRRVVAQLDEQVRNIPDVSTTMIIGGQRRQIKVTADPVKLAAFHLDPLRLMAAVQGANHDMPAGTVVRDNTEYLIKIGGFLQNADEVRQLVVSVADDKPVYLSDVAVVTDEPEEAKELVFFTPGAAADGSAMSSSTDALPAVTLAVAKRKGTNAVVVAERVLEKITALQGSLIPAEVRWTVTRNYGETAQEKSNELLEHLLIAIVGVTLLVAAFLGRRAALVVFIAVPATLAVTLFLSYCFGFTLNRVTLFGLILSIGILVDDPIVDVENIVRHFRMSRNRGRPTRDIIVEAVNEVRSPLLLATLAVIFALLPLAFVPGLLGAYTRVIPIEASLAMGVSMILAFVLTPWAAARFLQETEVPTADHVTHDAEGGGTRLYRRVMTPLIYQRGKRWLFLGSVGLLFVGAVGLLVLQLVSVKILPFDNKSEFQIVIDMPEGTPLAKTAQVASAIGTYVKTVPEVLTYETYVGTTSPVNFTGLVRHYFLRKGGHVADIHVNLLHKGARNTQSHDIVKRMRPAVQAIARQFAARVTLAEMSPGPPVLQTLVTEVYGPDYESQLTLAERVRQLFEGTAGVVDVDWSGKSSQPTYRFVVDKTKAALHGVSTAHVAEVLQIALGGRAAGALHLPKETEEVPLFIQVAQPGRSHLTDLQELKVISPSGHAVPLAELTSIELDPQSPAIHRKNLKPVVYVMGDTAGGQESPIFTLLALDQTLGQWSMPDDGILPRFFTQQPFLTDRLSLKWDGEWQTSYEFIGGVGFAFLAVLVLIYMLVAAWFQSLVLPFVILAPVPLSLIGILPAHALAGAFFTGASVIGFIAGAGIVVRNSIILVDFMELRCKEGVALAEAVIEAGVIRFRPMLLTALAVVSGAAVILFDPLFQGMAISLLAGEVVATLLSRMTVPVLYYLVSARGADTSRVETPAIAQPADLGTPRVIVPPRIIWPDYTEALPTAPKVGTGVSSDRSLDREKPSDKAA